MEHLIRAAGGVVWRAKDDGKDIDAVETAIVHRPRYGDWSIPKGKLSPGETYHEAAVREVFEETGYRVRLGHYLGDVQYKKTSSEVERTKVVKYWSMRADGGLFTPTREVDGLRWLVLRAAREMLSRESDRSILDRFVEGPIFSRMVLLVRHASAGSRSRWKGDDSRRPLDEIGIEQAEQLVRVLSRFGVNRIYSADYTRCVQTVEPLSEALQIEIQHEPLLNEAEYPGKEDKGVDFVRSVGRHDGAVVLSTQGEVVPDLLKRLSKEDNFDLPDDFEYKKASTWALTLDEQQLRAAEYFPPPI